MTVFDFIQQFILFVIPGVITYLLFCYLTGKTPLKDLLTVAIIFICSTGSFVLGNLFLMLINLIPSIDMPLADVSQILAGNTKGLTVPNVISAIVASIILGELAVLFWDKRILFRIANYLKITRRTDNDEVWDYMFDSQPWVIIRDYANDNVYYGCVVKYSDRTAIREILLVDVNVFSKNDGHYHMEQVYIARSPSEITIEIDNYANKKEKNKNGKK